METDRLILKLYTEDDKNDFIKLFTDAAVMKHVGEGVMTEEQAEAFWLKLFEELYPQNFNIWAIFTKVGSRYVGHAGIYPRLTKKEDWEFVYFLCRDAWDKGYATEIAQSLVDYAFEKLNLWEVYATVDEDHSASTRVLEKAGMNLERFEFDEAGRFSVYSVKKLSNQS